MVQELIRHTRVLEIVGDAIRVKGRDAAFGDLAIVENVDREFRGHNTVLCCNNILFKAIVQHG